MTEVREFLKQRTDGEIKEIDFIASYADGVIGRAIELLESEEFKENRQKAIEIVQKLNESKLIDVFKVYSFFEDNKDNIDSILDIMVVFYRDILIARSSGNENIYCIEIRFSSPDALMFIVNILARNIIVIIRKKPTNLITFFLCLIFTIFFLPQY